MEGVIHIILFTLNSVQCKLIHSVRKQINDFQDRKKDVGEKRERLERV